MIPKPPKKPNDRTVGTSIDDATWRDFKMACLIAGKRQNQVLYDLIRNYNQIQLGKAKGK
jgi:hypothetical protein